ncbi:MAG: redoxin family protein, partial [Pirellulales bacterium]
MIDAPEILDEAKEFVGNSQFLTPYGRTRTGGGAGGLEEKTQQLLQKLEQLDQQTGHAKTAEAQAENAAQRCDLLEQIADSVASPDDRAQWLRNLAETISAAVQQGTMPDGINRLKALHDKLKAEEGDQELAGYVRFRLITAEYNQDLQDGADFQKVQKRWLASLRQYVTDYPQSADAAEAMLQLATAEEFAGEEDEAKKWYAQIVDTFPKSASAAKAAGAIARLDSVGKKLSLRGTSLSGKTVDLAQFRKKAVLVQYWATWCGPCKDDMQHIKDALAKYGKDGFAVISISLDDNKEKVVAYLKGHSLPWTHMYEPGGLDSRLANELGVLTLPTMLLIDADGKVVNRGINAAEIDRELKALM